jgi:hypothetical protein
METHFPPITCLLKFQLWLTNVDTLVTNAEDLAFLQSMKGDRAASFGAFDKSLAKKIFRRQCREAAALNHLKRSRIDIETTTATVSSELLADEECNTNFTEESLFPIQKIMAILKQKT